VEGTKFFFTLRHAAAKVEDDQSMREGAELKRDLYRVVSSQFPRAHSLLKDVHSRIECGRMSRIEVGGIDARSFTRCKEHQFVKMGRFQSRVEEDGRHLHQLLLHTTSESQRLHLGSEFMEALIRDRIQQAGAIRIVTIDGHGSDTDPFRDGAHSDGSKAISVEKFSRGHEERGGCVRSRVNGISRVDGHTYTSYTLKYTP